MPTGTQAMSHDGQQQRKRRNMLLFAVHVALALAILGWFVYSVTHK